MSHNAARIGKPSPTKRRLKELLTQKDNRVCADCCLPNPKWASVNIGVFLCLKCCGVHRSLGTHISKVLSVTLDEWSDEQVDAMVEVGGNAAANKIYEAYFPKGVTKPGPNASHEEREIFIRSKYELQEFLKPGLRIASTNYSSKQKSSLQSDFPKRIVDTFLGSSPAEKTVGLVEYIGLLKVKVIKGTNLAIRDFMSSDPYVVLYLGKQKAQTSIMQSNLNPVWNEDLMLSVPEDFGTVKLEVFDQDTFSPDDIMGDAEIDIQPMIASATAFSDPGMFNNMQIGRWLDSQDNCLIEDSIVNIIDGKIKQFVSLKLQNVESGEVDLELEWMPLDQ